MRLITNIYISQKSYRIMYFYFPNYDCHFDQPQRKLTNYAGDIVHKFMRNQSVCICIIQYRHTICTYTKLTNIQQ